MLRALTAAGLLEHLLLLPGEASVAGGPGRPSAAFVRAGDFTGDAWQVPAVAGPAGHYETSRRHEAGVLSCRVVGRADGFARGYDAAACRTVHFPSPVFGLGVGAIGESYEETRDRFGELIALGGTAAYLPTDGALTPDWVTAGPDAPPTVVLGAGLVCEGAFSNLIRFRTQPGSNTVSLAELANVALAHLGRRHGRHRRRGGGGGADDGGAPALAGDPARAARVRGRRIARVAGLLAGAHDHAPDRAHRRRRGARTGRAARQAS